MEIRDRIKGLMKAQKLSAPKLSRASGVPLNSIKSILRGTSKNPQINTLTALARAFDCSLSEFLEEKRSPTATQEHNDTLFKKAIDIVEEIANEHRIDLTDAFTLKQRCVEKIYEYAMEKNKSSGNIVIDRVYADWVIRTEFSGFHHK